ncbi:MAG: hypothetical protein IT236_02210 [Bacteroidia bacterium]|nr:hypothetical protein [Bacteroidia bacterium]
MIRFFAGLFFVLSFCAKAQSVDSLIQHSESILKSLQVGDSVIYYQCHVEEAGVQISTASGQTLSGSSHKCSITEKLVVIKTQSGYFARRYFSSFTDLPNRKFTGLKLREKAYWNFKLEREFSLTAMHLRVLVGLERKGREAIEYDFVISKNNPNQLIIRHHKNFKQLVIDGDYVLSKLMK